MPAGQRCQAPAEMLFHSPFAPNSLLSWLYHAKEAAKPGGLRTFLFSIHCDDLFFVISPACLADSVRHHQSSAFAALDQRSSTHFPVCSLAVSSRFGMFVFRTNRHGLHLPYTNFNAIPYDGQSLCNLPRNKRAPKHTRQLYGYVHSLSRCFLSEIAGLRESFACASKVLIPAAAQGCRMT